MTKINKSKFNSLVTFATKGGTYSRAGSVLGLTDPEDVQIYMEKLMVEEPELYAKWAPAKEEEEEDVLAGFTVEDDEPAEVAKPVAKVTRTVVVGTPPPKPAGAHPKFRLKLDNGTLMELEVFSHHPVHGYTLNQKFEKDLRTIRLKGKDVEVDLLALQRDPDGMTDGVANSKLIALAELA